IEGDAGRLDIVVAQREVVRDMQRLRRETSGYSRASIAARVIWHGRAPVTVSPGCHNQRLGGGAAMRCSSIGLALGVALCSAAISSAAVPAWREAPPPSVEDHLAFLD